MEKYDPRYCNRSHNAKAHKHIILMYINHIETSKTHNNGWITQKALNKAISKTKTAWSTKTPKQNHIKKLQCNKIKC